MESRKQELEKDIQDLKKLVKTTVRPSVKEYLMSHCIKLEEEFKSFPVSESKESASDSQVFRNIEKFAWDDDNKEVKIYVTSLEGFKNHPSDKIIVEHSENSVSVAILDFLGNNYKLKFSKLSNNISGARITKKSNGFTLSLKKAGLSVWESVEFKPSAVKKKEPVASNPNNPQDELVEMMKEMYQNGDDDIRRTIAQAWMGAKDKNK